MTTPRTTGEIISFCSYKGGTGRSMAVANIACVLAGSEDKPVLVVDWDLEAPGLHHYFQMAEPVEAGLIDVVIALRDALDSSAQSYEEFSEERAGELWSVISSQIRPVKTAVPGVEVLQAGRFDDGYTTRVATFDWFALFGKAPWLLPWLFQKLAASYRYVLIDSRTGITDTSGICTGLLPEKLVVVFTPNRQSVEGACQMVRRAHRYRASSDDLRPLRVFPLPSRIEPVKPQLKEQWRFDPTVGYQPAFERTLRDLYTLEKCDLTTYFDEIQIQQVPDYAYGEAIAVRIEKTEDRLSLSRSYGTLADRMRRPSQPWERDVPDLPQVEVVFALTELLQAICLEFHVAAFPRGFTKAVDTFEAGCRSALPLTDDQYRRIKSDAEWVVKWWVEEDQFPSWLREHERLASVRLPGIEAATSFLALAVVSLRHAASIIAAMAATRDVRVELGIESGWQAWARVATHLDKTAPSAVEESSTYGDGPAVRLNGALSSFARVLEACSDWVDAHRIVFEQSRYRDAEQRQEATQLTDVMVLADSIWGRVVSEYGRQFRATSSSELSSTQVHAVLECKFEKIVGAAAAPPWRKARDEYRALGLPVSEAMGFVEFLGFYLSTVSKLLHGGVGSHEQPHRLGFPLDRASFDLLVELEVVPIDVFQLEGDTSSSLMSGPLRMFSTVFHDASRALLNALGDDDKSAPTPL